MASKLYAAVVTLAVFIIPPYLCSAFVAQSLNAGEWSMWLRLPNALWALCVCFVIIKKWVESE